MAKRVWGDEETQFFFDLTPDRILGAIEESTTYHCTGRILALNSMENRVYEIEVETDEPVKTPSEAFRIAKFYRPGRWTKEQILEEHQFLLDLVENEIPAVAPEAFSDGKTLHKLPEADIWYTMFRKVGGRSPDELPDDELRQVARLLGRLHNVGASRSAEHRLTINPQTYGRENMEYLLSNDIVPETIREAYSTTVNAICDQSEELFKGIPLQRIHGDCHFGNLLKNQHGFFWVDFDDMLVGPCVQDLWLICPGRDSEAQEKLRQLVEAYEIMRVFDQRTLKLIEPLRSLRMIHFQAWIAKRWPDPAFPKAFPYFGSERYWFEQLQDLREQQSLIAESLW